MSLSRLILRMPLRTCWEPPSQTAGQRWISAQQELTARVATPVVREHVLMKDAASVYGKLACMRAAGAANLQVITDFDMTLTLFKKDGMRLPTSHAVVENCSMLTEEYHDKVIKLKAQYYSIEINHRMSWKEKYRHMDDWWNQAHEALIAGGFNKHLIPFIVRSSGISFRPGVDDLFKQLWTINVPCLVFSAGLGDVIEEVLRQQFDMETYENVHVVSNFIEFDEESGRALRFKGKNIHVLNKCETCIKGTKYATDVVSRHNVILMGDGVGDVDMSRGVNCDNIIRIGFLNDNIEDGLDEYLNAFDVVIMHDGDMRLPLEMIKSITGQ